MAMDKFTPMNEQLTKRLQFKADEITVLDGNIYQLGRGYHATIEINGKAYKVYGLSCGLPRCECDAYVKEI
jgi:hypothetical protein